MSKKEREKLPENTIVEEILNGCIEVTKATLKMNSHLLKNKTFGTLMYIFVKSGSKYIYNLLLLALNTIDESSEPKKEIVNLFFKDIMRCLAEDQEKILISIEEEYTERPPLDELEELMTKLSNAIKATMEV